ncbi:hypothetical protein IU450_04215 [Nocardia abscessus]|uniref:hypothetical protein n=1 Tax=Nocardia abscessus TaxID=120957 RepID=UPI00189478A2|nr:hypothetical protein [Nocardia abscessus]MBF6335088.1 hypothetical protein [Nocardia abscessus]
MEELRSRLAHDNPKWVVTNPANARKALELHYNCDYSSCATLVAAVIVSREDYRYFRRTETNAAVTVGDFATHSLGSGA